MRYEIKETISQHYGLFTELGYEESDKRGYLTFTCNQGTYVAVKIKGNVSEDVWFYKFEKRGKFYDY